MRLEKIAAGSGIKTKLLSGLFRLMTRNRMPDVIRTLRYRRELFGQPFSDVLHEVMRGTSEWSPVERELFAAYTSKVNTCHF